MSASVILGATYCSLFFSACLVLKYLTNMSMSLFDRAYMSVNTVLCTLSHLLELTWRTARAHAKTFVSLFSS